VNIARIIATCSYHFGIAVWRAKEAESARVKYWEIIANRLMKTGWSLGWASAIDSEGRTIWIVDAHRGDGKRFIVRGDEKLSAFVEISRFVVTLVVTQAISRLISGRFAYDKRRGRESNPRIAVLQTATLPLGYPAVFARADNIVVAALVSSTDVRE
jgi:hypothetical protein